MALRLEDFPLHLQAAIAKQIAADDASKPAKPVITYCMATRVANKWSMGPECGNRALVVKLVTSHNAANPRHAHQTAIGNPPAKLIEIERVAKSL